MLDAFLEEQTRRPFADGVSDCALMVADWLVALGRPDPAVAYRGRYRTALGRERILRREGGLEAVMVRGLDLPETATPARGDVGLIAMHGERFAAICLGERWAIKSSQGLLVVPAVQPTRAWRVPRG